MRLTNPDPHAMWNSTGLVPACMTPPGITSCTSYLEHQNLNTPAARKPEALSWADLAGGQKLLFILSHRVKIQTSEQIYRESSHMDMEKRGPSAADLHWSDHQETASPDMSTIGAIGSPYQRCRSRLRVATMLPRNSAGTEFHGCLMNDRGKSYTGRVAIKAS